MKSLTSDNKRSFVPILQLLPKKEKAHSGRGTQAGGSTTSVAAAKSNVAAVASSSRTAVAGSSRTAVAGSSRTAVAGSSRTAAMSCQLDRSEDDDEDVQEDSPELDELERESDPLSTSSLLC